MNCLRMLCALALAAFASNAFAKVRTPSDDDKLQAACYGDVQRLCKDAIPDEEKITTCMKAKESMISAKCVEAYKATQAK